MSKRDSKFWPKWNVKISKDGETVFAEPERWNEFKIPFYGKDMCLILKQRTKDRSRLEERYYWGVVVRMVAEEMGVTRQEAHEVMAGLFLKVEEKSPWGVRYARILSTTELTDKRYHEYIFDECVRWAALPTAEDGLSQASGLGLFIPLPNEISYENL